MAVREGYEGELDGEFQRASEQLARWESYLAEDNFPEPGSQWAADDSAVDKKMPSSELARLALISGTESLQLVRRTLEDERGMPYVLALNAPIRTAILAGSYAIWLAAPNVAQRISNQYQAQHEFHRNFANYLASHAKVVPEGDVGQILQLEEHERGRIRFYREMRQGMGTAQKVSDTDIIEYSSELVLSAENALVVQSHWRLLSGDAHALGWPLIMRKRDPGEEIGDNLIAGHVGADAEFTKAMYISGVSMIDQAWTAYMRARRP